MECEKTSDKNSIRIEDLITPDTPSPPEIIEEPKVEQVIRLDLWDITKLLVVPLKE